MNTIQELVSVSLDNEYKSFDVSMGSIDTLSGFDFVEFDFTFYPLARTVDTDSYVFEPFEYLIDKSKTKFSKYKVKADLRQVLSGVAASSLLTGIVAEFNPQNLPEVESIFTIAASYYAGTKARPSIEEALINRSNKKNKSGHSHKLQFKERYYEYVNKEGSTAEKYDHYARKKRYGIGNISPHELGLIIGGFHQKIRMRFTKDQLLDLTKDSKDADILHIVFSQNEFFQDVLKHGFHIGAHVKLGKRNKFTRLDKRFELLQTLEVIGDHQITGIKLPKKPDLQPNLTEIRDTLSLGRIKYYNSFKIDEYNLIKYNNSQLSSTSIESS